MGIINSLPILGFVDKLIFEIKHYNCKYWILMILGFRENKLLVDQLH